jgi:hypothetical protein
MDAEEFNWHADVCKGKRKYRDRTSAKHAAATIKAGGGSWQRPYACEICDGYHLKSIRKHKKRKARQNHHRTE